MGESIGVLHVAEEAATTAEAPGRADDRLAVAPVDLPFMLSTANGTEAVAVEAIRADVTDYIETDGGPSR